MSWDQAPSSTVASAIRSHLAGRPLKGSELALWVAAPEVHRSFVTGSSAKAPIGLASRTIRRHLTVTAALFRSRGPSLETVADILFVTDPHNPRRTLEPVIELLEEVADQRRRPVSQRPSARVLYRLTSEIDPDFAFDGSPDRVLRSSSLDSDSTLYTAVRSIARARAVLARLQPKLVVVATQHAISSRAFLAVARSMRIPTLYIPHAPVAKNPSYSDLPTDYVGLRGLGETRYYAALGADPVRLSIVGNPSFAGKPATQLRRDCPVVFAPSPLGREAVVAQIETIVSAWENPLLVGLHPRMLDDPTYSGIWPPDWIVNADSPTSALLGNGTPCVIQSNSGIAWEALAHGIPTINLAEVGHRANYPFIREPYVPNASNADELRMLLMRAVGDGFSPQPDSRLIGWAKHWCDCIGADAAVRAVDSILKAKARGPESRLVLDGWRSPGIRP